MTPQERTNKRNQIVMALECATAYVRDDENLELAETDIETAGALLAELFNADESTDSGDDA